MILQKKSARVLKIITVVVLALLCAGASNAVERWLVIVWDDSTDGIARFEAFCMDRGMTSADVLEINGYFGGELPVRGRELFVPGSRDAFFFTWLEIQNRTGGPGPVFAITPRGMPDEAPEPYNLTEPEVYAVAEPEAVEFENAAPEIEALPEPDYYVTDDAISEYENDILSQPLTSADIEAMFEQRREEHMPLVTIRPHGMPDDESELLETQENIPAETPEPYEPTEPEIYAVADTEVAEYEIEALPEAYVPVEPETAEPELVEPEIIEPEIADLPEYEDDAPSQGLTGADIEAMFEQLREEHVPLVTIRPHGMPDDEPELQKTQKNIPAEMPEPYEPAEPEIYAVAEPEAAEYEIEALPGAYVPVESETAEPEFAEPETTAPEIEDDSELDALIRQLLGAPLEEYYHEPATVYDPYTDDPDDYPDPEYGVAALTGADLEAMFTQMREEHVPLVTIEPHDAAYIIARAQEAAAAQPPIPQPPIPQPPVPQVPQPPVTPPTVDEVRGRMIWPVTGRVSSGFGRRGRRIHHGIDIPMPAGTPILAALDGVVVASAGPRDRGFRGYGNTVVIDHGNGIVTLYAHNSQNKVTRGQQVRQGDVIALVGRTGRATTDHLHFEVRINGRPVDPIPFLKPR